MCEGGEGEGQGGQGVAEVVGVAGGEGQGALLEGVDGFDKLLLHPPIHHQRNPPFNKSFTNCLDPPEQLHPQNEGAHANHLFFYSNVFVDSLCAILFEDFPPLTLLHHLLAM